MTMTGGGATAMPTRAFPLAAAVLLHLAVLLPIGLTTSRINRPPPKAELVIVPLDLAPAAFMSERATRRVAPPTHPLDRPAPRRRPLRRRPVCAGRASKAAGRRRGGRCCRERGPPAGFDGPGGSPGADPAPTALPAAPGDRLGQRVCAVGPGIGRQDAGEPWSAPASSQRAAAWRRAREAGFERQVEANRAWRDYTRGESPYPGLRSLFSERRGVGRNPAMLARSSCREREDACGRWMGHRRAEGAGVSRR